MRKKLLRKVAETIPVGSHSHYLNVARANVFYADGLGRLCCPAFEGFPVLGNPLAKIEVRFKSG